MDTNNSGTGGLPVVLHPAPATPALVTPPPTVAPAGKARVAIGAFSKANHADLIVTSQSVLTGMTGNTAFPAPRPPLADLIATRNSYIVAVNAAKDSRVQIVVRNQRRVVLVALLRDLALYVQVASGGDLPTLMSSGFTAQRSRQPVGALPAPANLRLTRGSNSGQIVARCNAIKQAGAYEWRYANAATPAAWIEIDSTFAASVVISGLVAGAQYLVQVRVMGTAGPSDWSGAASLMVV